MVIKDTLFVIDVVLNYILLLGLIWSIVFPQKRIWPPQGKFSWQFNFTWAVFILVFLCNIILVVSDWNTWFIPDEIRFFVGIPLIVLGSLILIWGIKTLGIANTSGLKGGMVINGAYRFMRNPQYFGDIILFLGISLIANSIYVFVVHLLLIVVFFFIPLSEEVWLEQQYGNDYLSYKQKTARFF